MKFTAAALLALSAAAVSLKEGESMDVAAICAAHGPPPECGQMPEFPATASDKDIFLMIAGDD